LRCVGDNLAGAPQFEGRAMKGAQKPKHVAKKQAQKTLKEKRQEKRAAAKATPGGLNVS
jgi:hypothetical protein